MHLCFQLSLLKADEKRNTTLANTCYNSLKHNRTISYFPGHGKLIMRDGSYYEGSFFNGEISGRGVKYFAYDGQKYTGDFSCGEASGEGVVEYKDGSTYEGQFENNRREGKNRTDG